MKKIIIVLELFGELICGALVFALFCFLCIGTSKALAQTNHTYVNGCASADKNLMSADEGISYKQSVPFSWAITKNKNTHVMYFYTQENRDFTKRTLPDQSFLIDLSPVIKSKNYKVGDILRIRAGYKKNKVMYVKIFDVDSIGTITENKDITMQN